MASCRVFDYQNRSGIPETPNNCHRSKSPTLRWTVLIFAIGFTMIGVTVNQNRAIVHQNRATVHHNPATVHQNRATVHHNRATVHHYRATVHQIRATVHHNRATVHHNRANSHQNTMLEYCIRIVLGYCHRASKPGTVTWIVPMQCIRLVSL